MIWSGRTVVICASGPSMTPAVADEVRASGLIAIVTNDTWRLLPTAAVLFAANAQWWIKRNPRVSPTAEEFHGERFVSEDGAGNQAVWIKKREIGPGGNSALRACHLAEDRGAACVLLFGVDLRDDQCTHWHGLHKGLSNPNVTTFMRHRRAWEVFGRETKMEILNLNSKSGLRCFRFGTLVDYVPQLAAA